MIIPVDAPECERLAAGIGKRTILLNASERDFVLLKTPTHVEMEELLKAFRIEQLAWLRSLMTSEVKTLGLRKHHADSGIYGASCYMANGNACAARFLLTDRLPDEAQEILNRTPRRIEGSDLSRMMNLTRAEAKKFVLASLGTSVASMSRVLRDQQIKEFLMPELEQKLASLGAMPFLDWLAQFCSEPQFDEAGRRIISHVPFVLMLFLHRRGLFLFPTTVSRKKWFTLNIPDSMWLTKNRMRLYKETVDSVRAITKGYAKGQSTAPVELVLRQIMLRSTIDREEDVGSVLQSKFYDYRYYDVKRKNYTQISTITNKILRVWSAKVGEKFVVSRSRDRSGRDLFGWTYDPIRYSTPPSVSGDYKPNQCVIDWASLLLSAIEKMQVKNVQDARTAANTWLAYICCVKNPPNSLKEVIRSVHISNHDRRQKTYLSFVDSLSISANGKNKRISGTAKLFTFAIKIHDLAIENPISLDIDLFSEPPRRAKTPRTPLSREMLVYIQEFNRRDGAGFRDVHERLPPEVREDFGYAAHFNSGRYAFSRSLRQHHFDHSDGLTGELRKTWWPGVAVLLETLLEVPVRGFQARFLDSGELDELAIDLVAKTMVPNPSPKARANRQKGVFYIAEDLERNPIVGLYINTNKTGISKDGGYTIPWCPDPLLESIPWLIQWNHDHGNIGECRLGEKVGLDLIQNPVVVGQIGTSALIFRDPITNDGWPCTPRRLSSYWTLVLGAVERELKAMGFKYDLTRTIENDDGSTEVEALFDIHTLRVSGITAMIEAGLPAEFVQEVVGHASVVMTLYYTRIRAGVLNERLSRFREGISDAIDPADIPELQFEDVGELLRNLINRRDTDAAVGASMLRANPAGLGNGSFNVFADGICPGGECSSGGEAILKGFAPVPRHRACSLCRYRLTGPMFLAGLIHNANRLMFELRKLALQIRDLVQTAKDLEEQGRSARIVRNQIDGLYRQSEDVSIEWSAEVQYVHAVLALLQEASNSEEAGGGARALTLLSSETVDDIVVRLESKPDFVLLQRLAEGADLLPGFRPNFAALSDHREFLNHVLDQNGIEQFLLRLDGPMRDRAARLLGHAIVSLVPEGRLDDLENGSAKLTDFNIIVSQLAEEMAEQVARSKRVEFAALRGIRDLSKLVGEESEPKDAQLEETS